MQDVTDFPVDIVITVPVLWSMFRSACDGTVRVWSLAYGSHHFLQQTCIFNSGGEMCGEELDGQELSSLTWNSTGRYLAASMDNLVNVWSLSGRLE